MVTFDQLVGRAKKVMYRNVADVIDETFVVMTLEVAARRVAREAGYSAAAPTVLKRLQTPAGRWYDAPSLHKPIDLVSLNENRAKVREEILAAGRSALVVVNHEARLRTGRRLLLEGFDSCIRKWMAEASKEGIKTRHVGRPEIAYYDHGAKPHGVMVGTVQNVYTDQLLVVVATNYDGKYHVLQARALSTRSVAEARCFRTLAA